MRTVTIELPEDHFTLLTAFAKYYEKESLEAYIQELLKDQISVDADGISSDFSARS